MNLTIYLLYIIIALKFLYPFCIRYLNFSNLSWFAIPLLIIILFTATYAKVYFANEKFAFSENKLKPYKYTFIILMSVIFISAILNLNNMLLVMKSLFEYSIIYIILFLAVLEMEMSEKSQEYVIKFIYAILILQIPVTAFQYLVIGSLDADTNGGTISDTRVGGTGIIAILMTFLLSFQVCKMLINGFNFKRLTLALLTVIPIIAGGGRIAIILFPLTILVSVFSIFLLKQNRKISSFIKGLLVSTFILALCAFILFKVIPETKYAKFLDINAISSINNVEKYDSGNDWKESRILGYSLLFNSIYKSDLNFILGMGNEVITRSKAAGVNQLGIDFLTNRPDTMVFLSGTGVLGAILLIVIILISLPTLKSYLSVETSPFMTVVAYSLIPIAFNFIVSFFYTQAWNSHIGMIYWILLGILFKRMYVIKRGTVLLSVFNFYKESTPILNQSNIKSLPNI